MSAQYRSEYTAPMVGSSSCSYNTLDNYYGSNSTMAALKPSTTRKVYVTPNYASISHDALTHGNKGGCGGHFSITNAYSAHRPCTTYTHRLCKTNGK